jgi:hypothetical protein
MRACGVASDAVRNRMAVGVFLADFEGSVPHISFGWPERGKIECSVMDQWVWRQDCRRTVIAEIGQTFSKNSGRSQCSSLPKRLEGVEGVE